jgi:hypothetical protein
MERFRRETRAIVRQFIDRQISRSECEIALGQALQEVVTRLDPGQTDELFAVMKANTEAVQDEVERRVINSPSARPVAADQSG